MENQGRADRPREPGSARHFDLAPRLLPAFRVTLAVPGRVPGLISGVGSADDASLLQRLRIVQRLPATGVGGTGREAVAVLRRRAAGERIPHKVIDVGFRLVARESA